MPLTVEMCRETKGRYVSEAVRHWHDRYPWDSPGLSTRSSAEILDVLDELIATRLELKAGVQLTLAKCRERGLAPRRRLVVALRIIVSALARFGLDGIFEAACSAEHEARGQAGSRRVPDGGPLLGASPEIASFSRTRSQGSARRRPQACSASRYPRSAQQPQTRSGSS